MMNTLNKSVALTLCVLALRGVTRGSDPTGEFGFVGDAKAGLIVAPVRRTAVATTAVVASSSANANAAAQANANAAAQANANAAAQANAAAANAATASAKAPAGPPPAGTIVTTLPPGCTQTKLNGVDYQRCGTSYYEAAMMGSNLVFVVRQP